MYTYSSICEVIIYMSVTVKSWIYIKGTYINNISVMILQQHTSVKMELHAAVKGSQHATKVLNKQLVSS